MLYVWRLWVSVLDDPRCLPTGYSPEDGEVGLCMAWHGIYPQNPRDDRNRERFHLHHPTRTLQRGADFIGPFQDTLGGARAGQACCSDETMAFHYMDSKKMKFMYERLY